MKAQIARPGRSFGIGIVLALTHFAIFLGGVWLGNLNTSAIPSPPSPDDTPTWRMIAEQWVSNSSAWKALYLGSKYDGSSLDLSVSTIGIYTAGCMTPRFNEDVLDRLRTTGRVGDPMVQSSLYADSGGLLLAKCYAYDDTAKAWRLMLNPAGFVPSQFAHELAAAEGRKIEPNATDMPHDERGWTPQ